MKTLKAIQGYWNNLNPLMEKNLIEMINTQTKKYNASFFASKYYPCTDQIFRLGNRFGVQYRYLYIDEKDGRLYAAYCYGHFNSSIFFPDSVHSTAFADLSFTKIDQIVAALAPKISDKCDVFKMNGEFYMHRTVQHVVGGNPEWVKFVELSWEDYAATHKDISAWEIADSQFYGAIDKSIMLEYNDSEISNYTNKNFD